MNAKEYLSQVKSKQLAIKEKTEYIERMRGCLTIAGISYDEDKVQSSGDYDRLGTMFSKIFEAEEELNKMKEEFVLFKMAVIDMIYQLNYSNYIKLLNLVYIDYYSLFKVSSSMGYSYDYTRELHIIALREFEKKFPQLFC